MPSLHRFHVHSICESHLKHSPSLHHTQRWHSDQHDQVETSIIPHCHLHHDLCHDHCCSGCDHASGERRMMDLSLMELRVVSEMNSVMPFHSVCRCAMKLAMQAPDDFLRVGSHQKSEVPATNPRSHFKCDSPMKRLISLFRMNTMTCSRHSSFPRHNGRC